MHVYMQIVNDMFVRVWYYTPGLQNPRDCGTAGPRKKLTPAENFQNWKKKKKKKKKNISEKWKC